MADIRLATTDEDIAACAPVMRELRPELDPAEFLPRVRRLEATGYHLARLAQDGRVVAVAGFRLGENLAWGHFLYVDDLVTAASARSRGHGAALMRWLADFARRHGCGQLHLDSGTHRKDAHRFYLREGMTLASCHFSARLGNEGSAGL